MCGVLGRGDQKNLGHVYAFVECWGKNRVKITLISGYVQSPWDEESCERLLERKHVEEEWGLECRARIGDVCTEHRYPDTKIHCKRMKWEQKERFANYDMHTRMSMAS